MTEGQTIADVLEGRRIREAEPVLFTRSKPTQSEMFGGTE